MPDPVKISLPQDAADQFLAAMLPNSAPTTPAPFPPNNASPPMPRVPRPNEVPAAPPPVLPPITPASAPPASGTTPNPPLPANTVAGAVPAPGFKQGASGDAVPDTGKSLPSRIGGILGRVGGVALSALAPGVAQYIPQTPLGKIVADRRAQAQEGEQARVGLEKEQTKEAATKNANAPKEEEADLAYKNAQVANLLHPQAKTDFEAWQQQNQGKPISEWLKEQADAKAQGNAETAPLGDRVAPLNKALADRYNVLNPGKPLPPELSLPPNATQKDFDRVDKILQQTEQSQGTKAQQDTANEMRRQTMALAQEAAADRESNRADTKADREEKQGLDWVQGQDANGRTVAMPLSQAKKENLQNMAKLDAGEQKTVMDARAVVQLAEKQGKKPEEMGVEQLIDSLQKDGKLGPAASRLNAFLTGKVGILPDDDPRIASLLNKTDLMMTASMKANFGASGGRSPQMLEHFLQMADARKMSGPALQAGTRAVVDYMKDRGMIPQKEAPASGGKIPEGAIPGKLNGVAGYVLDGKFHKSGE